MARWEKREEKATEEATEVKHEVKSEQPQLQADNLKTIVPQSESTPVYLGSEIDAYIHERVKGQPKSLDEIQIKTFEEEKRPSVLALPKELEKHCKNYAFRW